MSSRRELIHPGQTGGMVIFEDRPNYWDAWGENSCHTTRPGFLVAQGDPYFFLDVEIHHLETARPLMFSNLSLVASGPLRATVRAEVKVGKSNVRVNVRSRFII